LWLKSLLLLAGTTRLELATSDVTGRRSNQLNYVPVETCGFTLSKELLAIGRQYFKAFNFALAICEELLANSEWLKAILVVGGTGFEPATLGL
jgi:hypothetical protein